MCRISCVCEINNFCYYFYNAIATIEATNVYWDSDQCIGPKTLVVWLEIELGLKAIVRSCGNSAKWQSLVERGCANRCPHFL